MIIRDETPADFPAIREVNDKAFGGSSGQLTPESRLVDQLRADGDALVSLVAVIGESGSDVVAGHILFSKLPIELINHTVLPGAALAPMAVLPEFQRRGIGSALVHAGITRCREMGIEVIAVLGHRAYYPRFGFSSALGQLIDSPFAGEAFMALELQPGALGGQRGTARYPEAFRAL